MSKIESKIRKERVIKNAHGGRWVRCVTSTKDYVITGGDDHEAVLWEKGGKGQKVRTFEGHTGSVRCLDTTPDGKYLVTGSFDEALILWEISSGNIVRSFKGGHINTVCAVAVTPSGDGIVSGSLDNTAILWNLHDGSILHTFKGHSYGVRCVCIDSTGTYLYTGGNDKITIKWDLKSGKRIMTYSGHGYHVTSISLASDKYLVTGSADETAIVWNVDDATPLRTFKGQHSDSIRSLCLSPDLRFLATCSHDNTTVLWDFHTTQPLHTFKDHTDEVHAVHITAENRLITGSDDGSVIQYDISALVPSSTSSTSASAAPSISITASTASSKTNATATKLSGSSSTSPMPPTPPLSSSTTASAASPSSSSSSSATKTTDTSYDIFISYRRSRVGDARLLKDTLERLGSFKVFLDIVRDDGLGVGDFQSQLERVLRDTPVVIVMVTPPSSGPDQSSTGGIDRSRLSSMAHIKAYANKGWTDWCRVEMATAVKMNKIIVPVYPGVEGGAFLGKELGHLQGLADVESIRGKNGYPWYDDMYPESVQKIVDAIKSSLAKRSVMSFKGEMKVTRVDPSDGSTKSVPLRLSTSRFKQLYTAINATWKSSNYWKTSDRTVKRRVSNLVSDFIEAYCKSKSIDDAKCIAFIDELLEEVDDNLTSTHGHSTAEAMAVLLWTSAKTLRVPASKKTSKSASAIDLELCSILNEIMRTDGGNAAFEGAVRLICMMQHFLNASRRSAKFNVKPLGPSAPQGKGWSSKRNTVYRGGSLPATHMAFFKSLEGKDQYYRVAHLVATSFDESKAYEFAHRASAPKVIWIVQIDPKFGCVHVNFIDNSLTAVKNESEYLFSAYSAFKVVSVKESATPENWMTPHIITLYAAPDNKMVPEDVPVAPWC